MSDIQIMNTELLEILKNYIEIYSFFNDKLEEIRADEILNINLELMKASITDLNINIANFKSDIESKSKINTNTNTLDNYTLDNYTLDNYTENNKQKQNLSALFFLYLMHIDKDSLLNKPVPIKPASNKSPIPNLVHQPNDSSTSSKSNYQKKKYEYDDLDLD
jgi:hypothetical protein